VSYVVDPEGNETAVIHELVDFRGTDVLEVGCGDGRLTERFAEHCRSVLAIDPDAQRIERAVATFPSELKASVTFEATDILDATLPPEAFDVVVLSWSI
jgi:2-polyprenyl-3-methyl-5-hydroxy-6-metoxy-1,4-benzoquinol methylase